MAKSTKQWVCQPGSYDVLHIHQQFESNNVWEIPTLPVVPRSAVPRWLAPYRERIRTASSLEDGGRHFFLDDYRFEAVWQWPERPLTHLKETGCVLTPDFSLFTDSPTPAQLWNTYRNRWCGAFWVEQGLTVIPTVSWSDKRSYDFCFAGIPERSVVAISTVGVLRGDGVQQALFRAGLAEMVERLRPTVILCYGRLPDEWRPSDVEIVTYPTRWDGIRAARKDRDREER